MDASPVGRNWHNKQTGMAVLVVPLLGGKSVRSAAFRRRRWLKPAQQTDVFGASKRDSPLQTESLGCHELEMVDRPFRFTAYSRVLIGQ